MSEILQISLGNDIRQSRFDTSQTQEGLVGVARCVDTMSAVFVVSVCNTFPEHQLDVCPPSSLAWTVMVVPLESRVSLTFELLAIAYVSASCAGFYRQLRSQPLSRCLSGCCWLTSCRSPHHTLDSLRLCIRVINSCLSFATMRVWSVRCKFTSVSQVPWFPILGPLSVGEFFFHKTPE